MKSMNLRQNDEQAAELELVARVDGVSITQAINMAITAHITARRSDPVFQGRLQKLMQTERDLASRLSTKTSPEG